MKKSILFLRRLNRFFCTGMTCKTNVKRDIIIVSVAIGLAVIILGIGKVTTVTAPLSEKQGQSEGVNAEEVLARFEEENIRNITTIQEQIDATQWKEYQSVWYGFKIKYPQTWKAPFVNPYKRDSRADYRVSFMTDKPENKNIIGFDVVVYDISKAGEFFQTDEFPKLRDDSSRDAESCKNIEGHIIETGDYPAEEIYIPQGDDCYNSVLFFTVTKGQYIYNIAPRLKEGGIIKGDMMVEVSDNLPEFFVAISQFENIDIIRPKPKPKLIQPKITAPRPASYKVEAGRLVCAKKNDKPSKSDKNKKKHLDMECCLDPDEYPNPNCYYPVSKYGKYLK